jgi:hypothetical protein
MVVGKSGVDVVTPSNLMPIVHWPWNLIEEYSGRKESDDPTDMELFMLTHKHHGEYVFECDEYKLLEVAFKKASLLADRDLRHYVLQPTPKQLSTMFLIFKSCEYSDAAVLNRKGIQVLLELVGMQHNMRTVIEKSGTAEDGSYDFHAVKQGLIAMENEKWQSSQHVTRSQCAMTAIHTRRAEGLMHFHWLDEVEILAEDLFHIRHAVPNNAKLQLDREQLRRFLWKLGKDSQDTTVDQLIATLGQQLGSADKKEKTSMGKVVYWLDICHAIIKGELERLSFSLDSGLLDLRVMPHFCYCGDAGDPSGTAPEQLVLVCTSDEVSVLDAVTRASVFTIPWVHVLEFEAKRESEDPTDMETFAVRVNGLGLFRFECDDAQRIEHAFKEYWLIAVERQRPEIRKWKLPVPLLPHRTRGLSRRKKSFAADSELPSARLAQLISTAAVSDHVLAYLKGVLKLWDSPPTGYLPIEDFVRVQQFLGLPALQPLALKQISLMRCVEFFLEQDLEVGRRTLESLAGEKDLFKVHESFVKWEDEDARLGPKELQSMLDEATGTVMMGPSAPKPVSKADVRALVRAVNGNAEKSDSDATGGEIGWLDFLRAVTDGSLTKILGARANAFEASFAAR